MSVLDWFRSTPAPAAAPARRVYAGAQLSRYVDFQAQLEAAHRERQRDLAKLRAHSRDLRKNNVYMTRFVEMVSTHVVGPDGITFESEILGNGQKPKEDWNDQIETAWAQWGRCCSTDGRLTWLAFQHLAAETLATDGECIIRMVRGYPNACGFAVEIIDADRLDHKLNIPAGRNQNRIIMGVEVDAWGRAVAYHVFTAHPGDYDAAPARVRIPADEILHLYTEDRTRATRGVPWATPCMVQLNMLGRLWTAELAAGNFEADRLGILKSQTGLAPDESPDPVAMANEIQTEHCSFLGLEAGVDVVFPQLTHPNAILPDFSRALLKGIAAGFGVSYHSLAGDVSDANYSSARVALLDERDMWKKRQSAFIAGACDPIFRAWLPMALLSGVVKLPVSDPARLCCPVWWPRSWDWVDPKKDAEAALLSIRGGLSTHQQELGARGQDWRETFRQLQAERAYAAELGLDLSEKPAVAPQPKEDTDA